MPLTKTQKAPSMAAQHGPSMARDALLKAQAPIASGFVSSLQPPCGGLINSLIPWFVIILSLPRQQFVGPGWVKWLNTLLNSEV